MILIRSLMVGLFVFVLWGVMDALFPGAPPTATLRSFTAASLGAFLAMLWFGVQQSPASDHQ
jgi:hypothetical protein